MRTIIRVLCALTLGALLLLNARAADEAKKSYDLPATDAATALKQFSEVSGRETLFAADIVRGVRTAAVKGEFTAKEALARMLAATGLTAVQDEKTGALAVKRLSDPNVRRAAQASDRPSPSATSGSIVRMDEIEVTGSRIGLLNQGVIPRG